jgi:hypothetical protein
VEAELSSPLVEGLLFKFLALTTAPQGAVICCYRKNFGVEFQAGRTTH